MKTLVKVEEDPKGETGREKLRENVESQWGEGGWNVVVAWGFDKENKKRERLEKQKSILECCVHLYVSFLFQLWILLFICFFDQLHYSWYLRFQVRINDYYYYIV